jgi:hypothetical protein
VLVIGFRPGGCMSSVKSGADDKRLQVSNYVSVFAHMGEVYVFHDLCGYILKMSADILDFLNEFETPVDPADICTKYAESFGEQPPEAFVGIFLEFGCLVPPDGEELDSIWRMVPVRGPWNAYKRHNDGSMTLYAAWGGRPLSKHELSTEEAAIWDCFDNETRLATIAQDHPAELVSKLVERLAHHDVQALKLSKVGLSVYKGRPQMTPPYLTSTMPYAPYDPATSGAVEEFTALFTEARLKERAQAPESAVLEHQESTLGHLFRHPHQALGGRSYGEALVSGLSKREMLPTNSIKVLEIGGGLGDMAHSVITALRSTGLDVTYTILGTSPALAGMQETRLDGLGAQVHVLEDLNSEWPSSEYDLIIANEIAGNMAAVHLTHADIGLDDGVIDDAVLEARAATMGEAGRIIVEHGLPLADAPEAFYLNVGAFQLLEKMKKHLQPAGFGVITECGELNRYPILSTHLEQPGLSLHWGQMATLAAKLGLETDYLYTMELIDLDGNIPSLSTTRSYFRALTALFEEHGVTLEKKGYTRDMLHSECDGKVDLTRIHELKFQRLEERLMGLVPYEYKTLIVGPSGVGVKSKTSLLNPGSMSTL